MAVAQGLKEIRLTQELNRRIRCQLQSISRVYLPCIVYIPWPWLLLMIRAVTICRRIYALAYNNCAHKICNLRLDYMQTICNQVLHMQMCRMLCTRVAFICKEYTITYTNSQANSVSK